MEKNLLLNKIKEIQTEYKELLTNIIDDFEGLYRSAALDEIVLFWTKNKPVVNMFLKHYFSDKDAFIMTAVTYLDIVADEQYPFFLAGSYHILDDPLGKYCEICSSLEGKYEIPLGAEILKCARDDLRVLNEYPQIIVIPMRLFKEKEKQEVLKEASEQLFLSLLSEISSIEEYFDKIGDQLSYLSVIYNYPNRLTILSKEELGYNINLIPAFIHDEGELKVWDHDSTSFKSALN